MALWADKYRPKALAKLSYHDNITEELTRLADSGPNFPHLLVYGPSGAGKKTRIMSMLRRLYSASSVDNLKVDVKTFVTPSNRKLEFNVISSPCHLEITPSDMGNNDRVVIQDLLKEIGQTEALDFSGLFHITKKDNTLTDDESTTPQRKFKVVIINESEKLSRDAQAALRRTMEKFSATIRLILICESTSNIIDPIKSRTLGIRIGLPEKESIRTVFENILSNEFEAKKSFPEDWDDRCIVYDHIIEECDQNLRLGIMMLEAMYMNNDTINVQTPVVKPDWQLVIESLAKGVIKDRSVARLTTCRTILYELLSHAIPGKLLLEKLMFNFIKMIDDYSGIHHNNQVKMDIVDAAALFDERLTLGSKDIFHLEGFVTKVMVILETDISSQ
ncbi:Replication factor C (RF-C) subunit [Pichia californica]|uniref:Replication factor C (RF-C) subunit n=1 Tax=Pichia californica TaxID=460514 RepID=A0A9P7BG70_9ASCO|nr:Replication factor C (RF-C) subunit [[Candida] californica]KAG0687948.1 Replication factor C (RF-C) subunit [[Candida] californica]